MRASRHRRQFWPAGILALLGALGFGSFGCGGSTPMDQWITMNPEAGAGFEAPVREVIPRSDGGIDLSTDRDDDGGAVTDDAATADGGTGSDDTGDSDAAAGAD
jgi:hypothetical protein